MRLFSVVVLAVVLGGCSLFEHEVPGGDDEPPCPCCPGAAPNAHCSPPFDAMPLPDAPGLDAGPSACDPIAPPGLQGCAVGQKCTWTTVQENPELGVTQCVPDGSVPVGGTCTTGPAGETTGFDNCVAGSICISSKCQDICGFGESPQEMCAAGAVCVRFSGLFANDEDDPIAGACSEVCDPLTSATCAPGQGCYVLTSQTTSIAVCAGAGTLAHNQPINGPAFANSCLPGHAPRRASQNGTGFECGALCRPAPVTSTTNMTSEGGVVPFTCESRGAAPPDSATQGESCRYYWAREPFDDLSDFSNTLGFCWKHATWQYDSNGDMTPDAPFPRCTTLTHGDLVPPIGNPTHDDSVFFWCTPLPQSFVSAPITTRAPVQLDRLDPDR